VCGELTAGVQTKAREPKLTGFLKNAGSDLLSHTAAEHARRPKEWRPMQRMGNCIR
jgi:hypothetical protein